MTFRLHAIGGMCNRIRAILGHAALHERMLVTWDRDETVAGAHFLDVFLPIPGVKFFDHGPWDREAFAPPHNAPHEWLELHRSIVLRPEHEWRVAFNRVSSGPYAAMHVRRTDHWWVARECGAVSNDDEFLAWARAQHRPIYLATDNGETQRRYLAALRPRVFVYQELQGHEHRGQNDRWRATSMSDAAIDLFTCVHAESFKGTRASTFTETIEHMRALR